MNYHAALAAYGTSCYKDVFSRTHALRFCFVWNGPSGQPDVCPQKPYNEPLGERFDPPDACTVWPNLRAFVAGLKAAVW